MQRCPAKALAAFSKALHCDVNNFETKNFGIIRAKDEGVKQYLL